LKPANLRIQKHVLDEGKVCSISIKTQA